MSAPEWVVREYVLAIHEELIARFGGLSGIRDEGLLESALARPQQLLAYGRPNLFEMAAAYAYGIVRNHPFLDGNKRTGFMSAYTFLGLNGHDMEAAEEDAVIQTLALAAGELSEADYAKWLRVSCGVTDEYVRKKPARTKRKK